MPTYVVQKIKETVFRCAECLFERVVGQLKYFAHVVFFADGEPISTIQIAGLDERLKDVDDIRKIREYELVDYVALSGGISMGELIIKIIVEGNHIEKKTPVIGLGIWRVHAYLKGRG